MLFANHNICFCSSQRLVVVCEDRITLHVVKDMELIHTITDTPANPSGVCALANSTSCCYMAYPASVTEGLVQIFDTFSLVSYYTSQFTVETYSFVDA